MSGRSKSFFWPGLRPWVALLLLAAGIVAAGLVASVAWRGGAYALGSLLFVKPSRYLKLAAFALSAAWLVWNSKDGPGALGKGFAKLVLFTVSLGLSFVIAEAGLRTILKKKLNAGTFEQFKEMKRRGETIKLNSATPLAAIVQPSDDPNLVYELQPNLSMEFGHKRLQINADGMRKDHVYPKERLPHSVRVLGIGDSGMFGWNVDQGHSYLDVFEDTLNARGDGVKYEALNTGTPGYNTQLEVALCRDRGLAYQPDIVVVGWCENDFFLPEFFFKQPPLPTGRSLFFDFLFNRRLYREELAGPSIGDRSNTKLADGKVDLSQVPEVLRSGMFEAGVTRALADLKELGAQHHFKILIFGPLKPDILAIIRRLNLEYCNTFEKIPDGKYPPDWQIHAMHPHQEGHRLLGALLVTELETRGWLKPAN
jgi:hypothetical protein